MIKEAIKCIGLYISAFISGTIVYAALFRTPLFADMPVYFYRACFLLLAMIAIVFAALVLLKYFQKQINISAKDILVCLVITFFLNFSFLSLITVALDRSISVFILSEMANNRDVVYRKDDVERVFNNVYINKYDAMERRFAEQIISGNIIKKNDGYQITNKGCELINTFRLIAKVFPIDNRFLYPSKE